MILVFIILVLNAHYISKRKEGSCDAFYMARLLKIEAYFFRTLDVDACE